MWVIALVERIVPTRIVIARLICNPSPSGPSINLDCFPRATLRLIHFQFNLRLSIQLTVTITLCVTGARVLSHYVNTAFKFKIWEKRTCIKKSVTMLDLRNGKPLNPAREQKRMTREKIPETIEKKFQMGIFYWEKPLPHLKMMTQLHVLLPYLTEERLKKIIIPIISISSIVSLRLLNYLVITYAKRAKLTIRNTNGHLLNIYNSYLSWLKYYKRYLFDTFRRGPRIYFDANGYVYSTTVAQLNFICWMEQNAILKYALDHLKIIETDMNQRLAECAREKLDNKRKGLKRKRIELSKAPPIKCFIYKKKVNLAL